MEDWKYDLKKLRVKPGDTVTADRITSIVDSMIEHRKAIEELREYHKS